MNWWGKIIGGTFGFMMGGPLGALFGAALGHNFDRGLHGINIDGVQGRGRQERVQMAFFTATFSIMGNVCKADGRVCENEIVIARQVMAQMNLSPDQKKVAMSLFKQGTRAGFRIDDVLLQARQEIGYQPNLIRMFMEIQLYAAYADGVMHAHEKRLLLRVCETFGIQQRDFETLAAAIKGESHHQRTGRAGKGPSMALNDAYAILGIASSATDAEVKKAYRRLMSQHHPDKLVSKGLPEEMMKIAEHRTHEARQAYERVKEKRGF